AYLYAVDSATGETVARITMTGVGARSLFAAARPALWAGARRMRRGRVAGGLLEVVSVNASPSAAPWAP
ncbi:hypothetical protein AB0I98_49345, partial [Streptomyces sp. NPDC050211]